MSSVAEANTALTAQTWSAWHIDPRHSLAQFSRSADRPARSRLMSRLTASAPTHSARQSLALQRWHNSIGRTSVWTGIWRSRLAASSWATLPRSKSSSRPSERIRRPRMQG